MKTSKCPVCLKINYVAVREEIDKLHEKAQKRQQAANEEEDDEEG